MINKKNKLIEIDKSHVEYCITCLIKNSLWIIFNQNYYSIPIKIARLFFDIHVFFCFKFYIVISYITCD